MLAILLADQIQHLCVLAGIEGFGTAHSRRYKTNKRLIAAKLLPRLEKLLVVDEDDDIFSVYQV